MRYFLPTYFGLLLLAAGGCQKLDFHNPVDANIVLLSPVNLSCSFAGDSTLRVQWTDPNQYTGSIHSTVNYRIECGTDGLTFPELFTTGTDSTVAYLAVPFQRLQNVYLRMRVAADNNLSEYSSVISTSYSLAAPYGVKLVSLTESEVRLTWNDTNTYKSSYEVFLSRDGINYTNIRTVGKDTSAVILQGQFSAATVYSFKVCTQSAGLLYRFSDTVQGRFEYPAPAAPALVSVSETSLRLSWSAAASFDRTYIVERKISGGSYSEIAQVASPALTYLDASLDKSKRYVYRIKAQSLYNTSAYSETAAAVCTVKTVTPSGSLIGHLTAVLALASVPSGSSFISGGSDGRIVVWDAAGGGILRNISGHSRPVNGLAVSPDGTTLASASSDKSVRLWRISDGTAIDTFTAHLNPVLCVGYSPDGKAVASGGGDLKVRVWYPAADSSLAFPGHSDAINAVAFSPDGSILASASNDHTIRLWSMSTGLLLRILNGHTSGVTSVQFTSDNTTLISGGYDKTIRYWNVADGTLLCTLTTDSSEVASVAISSDGRLLASGSADNRGHLCLTEDGLFPVSLSKHTGVVNAVVFTPNNTSCITASNDASVVIWKLTSEWTNMP